MKYVLLIYSNEAKMMQMNEQEQGAQMAAYFQFTQLVNQKGLFNAGEALMPTMTATTVRVADGKTSTTDGPFAETKEQLAGFYILNCKDLDEATEYAAKISAIDGSSIEVRPVMEMPDSNG